MPRDTGRLIAELDTPRDREAEAVIAKLVRIGAPIVPDLIAAAGDPSRPRVRKWSLQALGAIADRRAARVLVGALVDERMTVRLHSVRGLGRMRHRPAARAVARLLNDPSGGVRVNAIDALIAIGVRTVAPALRRALRDPQWYVRQHACRACGVLRLEGAARALRKLEREDPRKAVRVAASEALHALGDLARRDE